MMMMVCSYEHDLSTWPSRYYGRTRHVDPAKLYHDILLQSQSPISTDTNHHHSRFRSRRRVSFAEGEPSVYEYEPEYEKYCLSIHSHQSLENDTMQPDIPTTYTSDIWLPNSTTVYRKNSARKSLLVRRVDLRPVPNSDYHRPSPLTLTPSRHPLDKPLPNNVPENITHTTLIQTPSPTLSDSITRRRSSRWLVHKTSSSFAALRRKVL